MKKNYLLLAFFLAGALLRAAEIPGVPRDSNFNNTGGYDATRVEARLVVNVKDDTNTIHFVRDNNDPRVVTKTYLLKSVDPYQFRDYLRQAVQSKRVGNASLQQQYPGNTAAKPFVAAESSYVLNPATAQPGYFPAAQLGSNTAVECLKYVDGTGLLLVSAEEYRFKDSTNGIGIDKLVETLDNPALGDLNYGYQMFIYMPKFVPARNLKPLIENLGMNINDVTELWQGMDIVACDSQLNWLAFDVANYSCSNIAAMLKKFDVPIPQVRLKIKVYELDSENDDRIGIDFQSWKNNEGADLFSVGGRYRNNWTAVYSPAAALPNRGIGSERTSYYNFNPKWSTRYIDLLASRGKAKVIHSGEISIRNASGGEFSRFSQLIYIDTSQSVANTASSTNGAYKLLSEIIGRVIPAVSDIAVGKGEAQQGKVSAAQFGFSMKVDSVAVGTKETFFNVTLSNTSLIGFESNGTPRISQGSVVNQVVSLPYGKDTFVIGGLTKQSKVTSESGIPWLCEIPYLGYLFSSKSTSVKNTRLVVVGQCMDDTVDDKPDLPAGTRRETRGKDYSMVKSQ